MGILSRQLTSDKRVLERAFTLSASPQEVRWGWVPVRSCVCHSVCLWSTGRGASVRVCGKQKPSYNVICKWILASTSHCIWHNSYPAAGDIQSIYVAWRTSTLLDVRARRRAYENPARVSGSYGWLWSPVHVQEGTGFLVLISFTLYYYCPFFFQINSYIWIYTFIYVYMYSTLYLLAFPMSCLSNYIFVW